jgi:hypothetical protein
MKIKKEAAVKHLKNEDIARMIDGTVDKEERKTFMKHLSGCSACFEVYTETLAFMEKEKKRKWMIWLPVIAKIKTAAQDFRRAVSGLFAAPMVKPALALLLVIVLIASFVLNQPNRAEILTAQCGAIADSVKPGESHSFAPSTDEITAAFRAGVLVEDLAILIQTDQRALKTRVANLLIDELKVILDYEAEMLLPNPAQVDDWGVNTVLLRFKWMTDRKTVSDVFQLGRFVERTSLATFEKKEPRQEDIEEYLRLAREHKLPIGVLKDLEKLKTELEK